MKNKNAKEVKSPLKQEKSNTTKRIVGDFKLCSEIYDALVSDDYDIKSLAEIGTIVLGKNVSVLNADEGTLEVEELGK